MRKSRRNQPQSLRWCQISASVVICALLLSGCRGPAQRDVYSKRMASEIRILEDQLYDADYQNRVLRDELQRVKASCNQTDSSKVEVPTPADIQMAPRNYGPPIEHAPLTDLPSDPISVPPMGPSIPVDGMQIETGPIQSSPNIVDEMVPRSAPRIAPYGPTTDPTNSEQNQSNRAAQPDAVDGSGLPSPVRGGENNNTQPNESTPRESEPRSREAPPQPGVLPAPRESLPAPRESLPAPRESLPAPRESLPIPNNSQPAPREALPPPPGGPEPPGANPFGVPKIEPGLSAPPEFLETHRGGPPGRVDVPELDALRYSTPEVEELATPNHIRLHSSLSGGHQFDKDDEVDGLYVVVYVVDENGRTLNLNDYDVQASMTIVALDPNLDPDAARIGRWEFTPEEVSKFVRSIPVRGLHIPVEWQDVEPSGDEVIVHVRLEAESEEMRCQGTLKLNQAAAMAKWMPRGDKVERR